MSGTLAFLTGERLYLRPLLAADTRGPYATWFNDEEVCEGNSHHVFPYTPDMADTYIRGLDSSTDAIALAIVLMDGDKHVGNISLQRIDWVTGSAELAIVIGDKTAWNQGYALESSRLLCTHGFQAMNLHRISCGTFDNNEPMKRLASSLGMREEGRKREAAFKNGSYLDIVEFGVLRAEYEDAERTRKE